MTRQQKQFGVILGLIAIVAFASWPFYKWLFIAKANDALRARTQAIVESKPELKPLWDDAMDDDVLTVSEATVIVEKAGEKVTDGN